MTEMRARLVDKDGNPLGTASNPLKISGDVGGGVPDGGTTGQVLQKKSDADQDVEWGDGSGASTAWGSITGTLSDQTDLGNVLDGKATRTASDLTLYVYEDATGTGDGSSKANGFTSLQAAIDAIPDVAQNVTIIVCKGSTNYLGQTTTIKKASVKSLTIQGEFYAYEACDANAVAGKVVDADADFSDFEVGDRVVCTHYSGTVGSSSIDDYFYATITEVGEGYVQTSEETKVPTTGWKYLINQTVFDGTVTSRVINLDNNILCKVFGVTFENSTSFSFLKSGIASNLSLEKIIVRSSRGIYVSSAMGLSILNSAFISMSVATPVIDVYSGLASSVGLIQNCIFESASASSQSVFNRPASAINLVYCGFFSGGVAAYCDSPNSKIYLNACYIDSSYTYGAYGYNITLVNCTNNAATPVYNLTSGGSIKEWDGQALPSIDDATGGQVLALKSDKSALEFATVLSSYTLPVASADTLGGVKVGSGLTITDGVLSADEQGGGLVKVSSNDTTAGYLLGKLVAGTNITLTEGSDGGNETLTIASTGGLGGFATLVQRSLEGVVYETTLMYWRAPAACTIQSVSMSLSSNPSAAGSYCKVQVMKNGLLETNSIFTADTPMQITELTSASNGIYTASGTLDSGQTTIASGDVIQFRVNQADTGSADLLVQMKVTFT